MTKPSLPAAPALTVNLHGVLLEIMGLGVLVIGRSGIGKSELALELITRGHCLVADDAPVFTQMADGGIRGDCPAVLHHYLHVRALGMLDVVRLFGCQALSSAVTLELVVELEDHESAESYTLDAHAGLTLRVLNSAIPLISLNAASPRLALLVECAVRRQLALQAGNSAEQDFQTRLNHALHHALS